MAGRLAPNLAGLFDWRSWSVFQRNGRVYFRNWKTAFFPPAMEPVVFFVAFGMGLGAYVGSIAYGEQSVSYPTYVAPGLLAYAAFSTPFFEALYGAYVRMFYQKTWHGILATQVELPHILWGEITWAGARGMMNASIVAVVLLAFQLAGALDLAWYTLVSVPLLAFVAGWAFAAFALIFTAIVPSIDHMNYPVFLIGIPLGLVSNTYFPVRSEIVPLQVIIELNPIYHLAETFRCLLLTGLPDWHLVGLVLTGGGMLLLSAALVQPLMRRRVLGE
jgi:lipooligosaccharide transport system permease protein